MTHSGSFASRGLLDITFAGAAREVTGSCHIVHANGKQILLDCGLFQGRRHETHAKNVRLPTEVAHIDAIVLSHAHIDHAGRLPLLVREGYRGTIWCTAATRDLAAVMLADSAQIQERDADFLTRHGKSAVPPLYSVADAARTAELMAGVPYGKPFEVTAGMRVTFVDAGHILGSASVVLDVMENGRSQRLVFSGDVGRSGLPIIRDPQPPEHADVVIMESTYGDRDHLPYESAKAMLGRIVTETAARGGRILIPAFAVGRVQEIVYDLHSLSLAGEIPAIPIYIDSPLAIETTAVFEMHPEVFDHTEDFVQRVQRLFRFQQAHYTREARESKALNSLTGPMVVIAPSGMAEAGRILHHLKIGAPNPRNTILIVGFQAEHTLGRRIVERRSMLKIHGEDVPLRARVEVLDGYSAHADRTELTVWLKAVRARSTSLRGVYLVHGEPGPQDALATDLRHEGFTIACPEPFARVTA
jgi:metallo-beta-lactamase family protein